MEFHNWKNVYQIDGNSEFLKFKEKIKFQVKKTFRCVRFVVLKTSEVFLTQTEEIKKSGRRSIESCKSMSTLGMRTGRKISSRPDIPFWNL